MAMTPYALLGILLISASAAMPSSSPPRQELSLEDRSRVLSVALAARLDILDDSIMVNGCSVFHHLDNLPYYKTLLHPRGASIVSDIPADGCDRPQGMRLTGITRVGDTVTVHFVNLRRTTMYTEVHKLTRTPRPQLYPWKVEEITIKVFGVI